MTERLKELLEIVRDMANQFVPYERGERYKVLEKLRALEVNIERDQRDSSGKEEA
jgi:hypothetical protein